jgi:hypothetical protein
MIFRYQEIDTRDLGSVSRHPIARQASPVSRTPRLFHDIPKVSNRPRLYRRKCVRNLDLQTTCNQDARLFVVLPTHILSFTGRRSVHTELNARPSPPPPSHSHPPDNMPFYFGDIAKGAKGAPPLP